MAARHRNDVIGGEPRGISQRIESGDGMVKPTAPPDVEGRAGRRCGAHPVQIGEFITGKTHVVGA